MTARRFRSDKPVPDLIRQVRAARLEAARNDALEEDARVAETHGVYLEMNVAHGGPVWFRHGKNIAAGNIRALKDGDA